MSSIPAVGLLLLSLAGAFSQTFACTLIGTHDDVGNEYIKLHVATCGDKYRGELFDASVNKTFVLTDLTGDVTTKLEGKYTAISSIGTVSITRLSSSEVVFATQSGSVGEAESHEIFLKSASCEEPTGDFCADPTVLSGEFLSSYEDVQHICTNPTNRFLMQSQYWASGSDARLGRFSWHGNLFAAWSFSLKAWVGLFASSNGIGSAVFTPSATNDALFGDWHYIDASTFFDLTGGQWNVSNRIAAEPHPTTCEDWFTSLNTMDGVYDSTLDENITACHISDHPPRSTVAQVEFLAKFNTGKDNDFSNKGLSRTGYAGIARVIFNPMNKTFYGNMASLNGKGPISYTITETGLTGTYLYELGGSLRGKGSGTFEATKRSAATTEGKVESTNCMPWSELIPDITGVYYSDWQETVHMCNLHERYPEAAIVQSEFIGDGYKGRMMLIYVPSEESYKGTFTSDNGKGDVFFSVPKYFNVSSFLPGFWVFECGATEGADLAGWWGMRKEGEVPDQAVCKIIDPFTAYRCNDAEIAAFDEEMAGANSKSLQERNAAVAAAAAAASSPAPCAAPQATLLLFGLGLVIAF